MIQPGETGSPAPSGQGCFATTHWSVVLAAGQGADARASNALEQLCRAYWYPLYAFVRRQGHDAHDAQDLTQGFFARLLEKDYLATVGPDKGRFRSFLLTALKRFLADEHDKATARKRGGGQAPISLDAQTAEDRYRLEPAQNWTPERLFDRRWAMTVLQQAHERLRGEYRAAGKGDLFEALKAFHDQDETTISYKATATQLTLPENTVKSHVHRLRRRYRQLLRDEIAHTVSGPADVEEEIRYLLEVASGG